MLSKDKVDESQELISQYFEDHFVSEVEDSEFKTEELQIEPPTEEKEDIQVTFDKEVSQ
jgi:hypothetical protein